MERLEQDGFDLALVVVVLLFLFFCGGAMTGSMLGSGMTGQGGIGGYRMGRR